MENSKRETQLMKIFRADTWDKLIQKFNSFSKSNNVKVYNYQTDMFRDTEKTMLVFYSIIEKEPKENSNDTE